MKRKIVIGALCLTLIFSASCRGIPAQAADMMAGVQANPVNSDMIISSDDTTAIAEFSVKLFQNSAPSSTNTLISPFSVLYALAMTANGAKGETLDQMENTFGLTVPELNRYLHAYLENLPSADKYKFSAADSIWLKDDDKLKVERDFLQTNADYYGASIYKAAFDNTTLRDINAWVSNNTDGMIEKILDKIPEDAIMYLINALAFSAEWENTYNESQVCEGTFTTKSGGKENVEMMYDSEHKYLDDGNATGFLKYYADRKYAFAALLPNEGVSINDYVASLTGKELINTLHNARDVEVKTAIPKFKSEYSVEMSSILKSMGLLDAFSADRADFSGLGHWENGNIFISQVLHKTYIAVDEKGTKAGAATIVEMMDTGCAMPSSDIKTVYLDRPFVYMLIDCETNFPIFFGTTMEISQ
ncbi:MAG: serpin family protein [Intestinimonas sp.]|jgi:serpin B|nr:serpin family protein [Intestinimonas sp.]